MAQLSNGEQIISLPELKFKVPQSLLDKLGEMRVPLSLLITIPARHEPASVNGCPFLEISYDQALLEWKVDITSDRAYSSAGSDDNSPMKDPDSDPVLTQSVLSHII